MPALSLSILAFIAVANFGASIVQGVTSFGDAIVLHIVFHAMATAAGDTWLFGTPLGSSDVTMVTLLMYSRTVVLNVTMVVLMLRAGSRFVPLTLVAAAVVPQLVMTLVGEALLVTLPKDTLKFWFGVACMSFALAFASVRGYRWLCASRDAIPLPPATPTQQQLTTTPASLQWACVLTSACAGLSGALTGVGGPPWMVFILAFNLPASMVRLLFPLATLPSIYARYWLAWRDSLITVPMLPYHGTAVGFGFVGVLVGNFVGKRIGPETFNAVVLTLLTLASVLMIINNPWVLLGLLAAAVALLVTVWHHESAAIEAAAAAPGSDETALSSPPPSSAMAVACKDQAGFLQDPCETTWGASFQPCRLHVEDVRLYDAHMDCEVLVD